MLEQLRNQLRGILSQRAAADAAITAVTDGAALENRTTFTADESAAFKAAKADLIRIDAERVELEARIAELEALDESRAAAAAIQIPAAASGQPMPASEIRVGAEAPEYRQDGQHSFFIDMYRAQKGDYNAQDRIRRNAQQAMETRAPNGVAADFGALVTPQYLLDMFAPVLRAGRPFINQLPGPMTLPEDGLTLTIPLGTTGTTVRPQATENSTVSLTSYGETDLVIPVRTFGGRAIVSQQTVDRGMAGIDTIIMSDLTADYTTQTDVSTLLGTGNAGDHYGVLGSTSVAGTAVTSGVATTVLSKIAGGIVAVNQNRLLPANLIVMHPRRWGQLSSATDSNGRPLLGITTGAYNVFGEGEAAMTNGIVGAIFGVPVLVDVGVGTAQGGTYLTDPIIITRTQDCLFWEESGAPNRVRLDEILKPQLSVEFVLYGYSAFTAARYLSASYVLTGTGLVAPSF